jgi:UDP-N-acetylmuramate--alanine ligase
MHVHFMGIGGSGMSAVAQIAKAQGFTVTGCDLQGQTPYSQGLDVLKGHAADHLKGVDILAVTPAVYFQSTQHPELTEGREKKIVMTWQEFMGKYLHKNKLLICIAGTHGKSTTTTMAGLLLEQAGLDPTVEVGATVPAWHSNVRHGKSEYFISEADEYYHNFQHYTPDIVILNNIELDHPEYFKTLDKVLEAFQRFIDNIKPGGTLIYNADSENIKKLKLPKHAIGYSLAEFPKDLKLGIPGEHNKANAMGIIKLGKLLKIKDHVVYETLKNFSGIGRRLELLGDPKGIKVYDDYANLPTAFAANLTALKQVNPQSRIWAIIEPHTFSRLKAVLTELKPSLALADKIIISKVFASRETDPGDFSGADIAKACDGEYIPEFKDIVAKVSSEAQAGDIVLIMGSGDSYKLARLILEAI